MGRTRIVNCLKVYDALYIEHKNNDSQGLIARSSRGPPPALPYLKVLNPRRNQNMTRQGGYPRHPTTNHGACTSTVDVSARMDGLDFQRVVCVCSPRMHRLAELSRSPPGMSISEHH